MRPFKRLKTDIDASSSSPPNAAYLSKPHTIESLNALSPSSYRLLLCPHIASTFPLPQQRKLHSLSKLNPATSAPQTLNLDVEIKTPAELSKKELEECLALIRESSKEDYARSSDGWNERRKRREMRSDDLRYVLLRQHALSSRPAALLSPPTTPGEVVGQRGELGAGGATTDGDVEDDEEEEEEKEEGKEGQIMGFLSFMLTHECDPQIPVLYIYEIHLSPSLRGLGVGRTLMTWAQEIARRARNVLGNAVTNSKSTDGEGSKRKRGQEEEGSGTGVGKEGSGKGVQKLMLTVFKANERARKFYEGSGWEVDEESPRPRRLKGGRVREWDYEIWSKRVV